MPGTESPAPAAAAGTTTAAAAAAAAGPSNAANNGNAATAAAAAHARSASDEAMDAVAEARAVWPGAQTLVSVQELLDQNKSDWPDLRVMGNRKEREREKEKEHLIRLGRFFDPHAA